MAGEITAAIVARIRVNVRDAVVGAYTFQDGQIYDKLNDTQLEMGLLLPVELLGEFITPAASPCSGGITGGSGAITVSVLGSYERAIIRAYDATDNKWMTKIENLADLNNSYLNPTTEDPMYRVAGSLIYVYPTTITSVKTDYLKAPTAIASGVDPTLNSGLHYLLQKGAEWRLRATLDDKNNLTEQSMQDYYKEIQALVRGGR